MAGVRGSRTHLPRSSRGITDLNVRPASEDSHELLTLFLSDKQAKGLSPQTINFCKGYLTSFFSGIAQTGVRC